MYTSVLPKNVLKHQGKRKTLKRTGSLALVYSWGEHWTITKLVESTSKVQSSPNGCDQASIKTQNIAIRVVTPK